jgi:uncharacterized protein YhfF
MEKENKSVTEMWKAYLESVGETPETTEKKYEAWHFCNNETDANELAELVIEGTKRATASLYDGYAFEKEEVPIVGDHSVIIDWDGTARCIIKTTVISIVPFKDVSTEFAATEGEGDKSLEFWKRAHLKFFKEECAEMSKEFNEDMLVVCEAFEVVYK